ncbi:MAG: ECF transporter S component [Oscillospiraceae bacterium]|nr:ECF transporter S component [Oscillospiraceae bacterium]
MNKTKLETRQIALAALLTAIVVVLQVIANFVQPIPGVSITLVLVPVVIGAALLGKWIGAWLGFVFGAVVLALGGAAAFLLIHPVGTVVTVLVKGSCAGLAAGIVYKLLEKINPYLAVLAASFVCPVVNTGLFFVGCRLFFWKTIQEWGVAAGFQNTFAYMVLGLAGINFLIELGINLLLAPTILRLIRQGKKKP